MRALMKTRQWVDIDTSCLFNNQYNTTEACGNKRIFDGDIIRIEDDARVGKGICRYCGKLIKYGEEEEHFREKEMEKAQCSMDSSDKTCTYKSKHFIGKTQRSSEKHTEMNNGIAVTTEVVTTVNTWKPYCSYVEHDYRTKNCECTCDEHRARGIEWFTPKNTFFLRYPTGFQKRSYDLTECQSKWEVNHNLREAKYVNKIGSFKLSFTFFNSPGWTGNIENMVLHNGNYTYIFNKDTENNAWIIYDGINHSPRISKHLLSMKHKSDSVVMTKLNKILEEIHYGIDD